MHISKILIKNFKCIQELSISPNEKFNVIVGENNQGKTTIFEALQIWYRCYQLYIKNNRAEFYIGNNLYFPYKDLNFLRLAKDTDLFNSAPNEALIGLTLADKNSDGDEVTFDLQFKINRPQSISNAYLRVLKNTRTQFERFASHLKTKHIKLDDAIFLYQTNPISHVLSQEPFMNEGQVRKKIMRGKSQEVLRSKILLHSNLNELQEKVSSVLNSEVRFKILNKDKKNKDEYINLQVENAGKSFDIYLQGSGLIQITEIFATVDYLESKLNILLIDEPDSHIHLALQKRLIHNLKNLSDNQTFIITHNDAIVNEVIGDELFYLNGNVKLSKVLRPIEDADLIKKDFGSPILTLENLNNSSNIVFVEGNDDKQYLTKLVEKYCEINLITNPKDLNVCFYFQVRGKDDLSKKIDHNKRILSQLFKDKRFVVVTDKDFTKVENSVKLNKSLEQKLGSTSSAFCHDGYCIESTLFSELNKLHQYLASLTSIDIDVIELNSHNILDQILEEFKNITASRSIKLEQQFNSQKNNRTELEGTSFRDVLTDGAANRDSLKYLMNKGTIREYINYMETNCGCTIVTDGASLSDEDFCISLFSNYIEEIPNHNILFENHKSILNTIYGAEY